MHRSWVKLGWPLEKIPTPTAYPGGKSRLSKKILRYAPPHKRYVEPFAGGLSVYFAKKPAQVNILSDVDPQVTGFYGKFSCRRLDSCKGIPPSMPVRIHAVRKFRSGSSDTCDYVMARTLSFNSRGVTVYTLKRKSSVPGRTVKWCRKIKERLGKAKILTEDFRKVARKNDLPDTWQYWDPPYVGRASKFYQVEKDVSPEEVCSVAKSIKKAKVLISHYDTPKIRKACAGLYMKSIPHIYTSRTMHHGKAHRVKELLMANYPLDRSQKPWKPRH